LWLSLEKFILPSSVWGLIVKNRIDLGGRSERFRVEKPGPLWTPQWRHRHLWSAKLREQILCLVCSNRFTFEAHIHVLA
jgi:hypothetical protein